MSKKRVATEVFQLPLLFGVLLLVWRRIRARGPALGGVLGCVLVVVACGALHPNTVAAQSVEREGREAERAYEAGEFERALELFQQRDEPRFRAGRGAALYRLGRYEEAAEEFARAAEGAKSEKQRAEWLYNGGNALLQLQKPEAAIKQYEQSLAREPRDRQARENLAYAKALLEKQQQSKERSNQESQKQQPKQSSNSNESSSGGENSQPNNQGGEDKSKPRNEASSPKNDQPKNDQQQSEPQPLNPKQGEEQQQSQPDEQQPEKTRQDKVQQGKNQPVEKPQDQQSGETQGTQEPHGEAKDNRGGEENTAQQQEGEQQNSNQQDAKQRKPSESEQFSEALLRGLQEDRSALLQYRRKKALEERERDASRSTGKDW